MRRTPETVGPGAYETSSSIFRHKHEARSLGAGANDVSFMSSQVRGLDEDSREIVGGTRIERVRGPDFDDSFASRKEAEAPAGSQLYRSDHRQGMLNLVRSAKQGPFEPSKASRKMPGPGAYTIQSDMRSSCRRKERRPLTSPCQTVGVCSLVLDEPHSVEPVLIGIAG